MIFAQLFKKGFFYLTFAIIIGAGFVTPSCYSANKNTYQLKAGCTFCDIALGTGSGTIWAENDDLMVIGKPARTGREATDLLIIPKKHILNMKTLDANNNFDATILSKMGFMAQQLGKLLKAPGDFWVEVHNGADAFQSVMHLHMHFKSHSAWAYSNKKPIRVQ